MSPPTFNQFDQHKLGTDFYDGYCKHTIATHPQTAIAYESQTATEGYTETWTRGEILGRGAFGTVWLEMEERGALRVVKQISKTSRVSNARELLALTRLNMYPEYFVQFFGWFEDNESIYLAMEYIKHGDLASLILERDMNESDAKIITTQLLGGLNVMHKNNFCHRDLKPQNILIVSLSPIVVKITDFSISKQAGDGTAVRTVAGTSSYIAPEIWGFLSIETSVYTSAVDIWSLGCLIHAIITKMTPFPRPRKLIDYTLGRISFPTRLIQKKATWTAIKFITSLMMPHPEERPTAEQALNDPWFSVKEHELKPEWDEAGEETLWIKSSGEVTVADPGPEENLVLQKAASNLKLTSKQPCPTEKPHVETVASPELHDCTTPYCAVAHENWGALQRFYRDSRADQGHVNAKQVGNTTLLHMAVRSGKEDMVRLLVENGADIRAKDGDHSTPLHLVAETEHQGIARLLLEGGADIEERNAMRSTALHLAVRKNRDRMTQLLLENGADIAAKDGNGLTALHLAAYGGHKKLVQRLLYNRAEVMATNDGGFTALHLAAQKGHRWIVQLLLMYAAETTAKTEKGFVALHLATKEEVAELLLENGSDIMARDAKGYTALHLAAQDGLKGLVELFLENGADIQATTGTGLTALHLAVQEGHEETAKHLLENGADITTKTEAGHGVLHLATRVRHNFRSTLKLLLENGVDIMMKDAHGFTALHLTVVYGHREMVRLLLENGAVIMAKDRKGFTALHLAAFYGYTEMVEFLLENGAVITEKDGKGFTALHLASQEGHEETVRLLIDKGAQITANTTAGYTALHLTLRERVAKVLLENGAQIMARTGVGFTLLHIAALDGHKDMVRFLLATGADLMAKTTGHGFTALHLASQGGHKEIVRLLLEKGADMAIDERDEAGSTALHLAVRKGHDGVVKLLLENRADIMAKDKEGCAALHLAVQERHKGVLVLLVMNEAKLEVRNKKGRTPLGLAVRLGYQELVDVLRREMAASTTYTSFTTKIDRLAHFVNTVWTFLVLLWYSVVN